LGIAPFDLKVYHLRTGVTCRALPTVQFTCLFAARHALKTTAILQFDFAAAYGTLRAILLTLFEREG
jgi:hypothetical protein